MSDFTKEKEFLDVNMGGCTFERAILAGGAITSAFTKQKIRDYDLYFRSKADFDRAVEGAYDDSFWCVALSSRAITFAKDDLVFQLMYFKWFADPAAIFESFDFTVCMAALDLDSKEFVFHPRFLADTAKRELMFNHGTDFPLASGVRVLKYQERGYSITKRELVKLLVAVSFKKTNSWQELSDQIGGHYGESVALDTTAEFTPVNIGAALDKVNLDVPATAEIPSTAEEALGMIWRPRIEKAA